MENKNLYLSLSMALYKIVENDLFGFICQSKEPKFIKSVVSVSVVTQI